MTITFNLGRAGATTQTRTETQVQQLVGSKGRVETNGQTDGRTDATNCFTLPAYSVGSQPVRT